MKAKALVAFKSKLWKPCKNLVQVLKLKFRFKKPISIKAFQYRRHRAAQKSSQPKKGVRALLSTLLRPSSARAEEMDRVSELRSMTTDAGRDHRRLFPSPLTPAYLVKRDDEVEDACCSFENYLVEMIVEEGKVGDLVEVEELLYCWKNLKCPVFSALVCRFYGELCKDLFSGQVMNSGDHQYAILDSNLLSWQREGLNFQDELI